MFRKVFSTSVTLAIISLINLAMLLLVSNYLGKSGVTKMGLIVLGISFIVMMNNIIGGSSLVYMTPRNKPLSLLIPSYIWGFVSTIFMGLVLYLFELVPLEYIYWVIAIGFAESLFSVNIQFFLGLKKIGWHNSLKIIQKLSVLSFFIYFGVSIENYVLATFISVILVFVISFFLMYRSVEDYTIMSLKESFVKLFKYGFQIQSSNILQLLNYRLIYVIIEKTMGEVLGIYIVAVQLAESLWIPSKAIAIIQYSTISNEKNENKHYNISISFLKISFFITLLLSGLLIFIPEDFIGWIFGKDFTGVTIILVGLLIGILAISINLIISHYFSGKGIYMYNLYASAIGLIVIVLSGWILIDKYELIGAAIASSLTYLSSTIYFIYVFKKTSQFKFSDLLLRKQDIKRIYSFFKKK